VLNLAYNKYTAMYWTISYPSITETVTQVFPIKKISSIFRYCSQDKTRGPRGPWVAHLRKRSKVTVDSITENPRGII